MKKILLSIIILLAFKSSYALSPYNFKVPKVNVESFILMDAKSGAYLIGKNPDARLEPASLTKIATLYIAFQNLKSGYIKMSDQVIVSEKAWRMIGSRTFLEVGKKVTVEKLIKGIVVQSGNDATVALAEHIGGSEDFFVSMMNSWVKKIGLKNTNFTNVTGLPNENHYSSARDMAIISQRLVNDFPEYYSTFSEKKFRHNKITQYNRNKLLRSFTPADGIKTGHTESAGYCLSASAFDNNIRLVSVLFGAKSSKDRFNYSKKLLKFGFRNFESVLYSKASVPLLENRVWFGAKKFLKIGFKEDMYLTLLKISQKKVSTNIKVLEEISAPIEKNQRVGEIEFLSNNEVISVKPLYALESVEEGNFFNKIIDSIIMFFKKN